MRKLQAQAVEEVARSSQPDLLTGSIRTAMQAQERSYVPVSDWAAEHMRTERGERLDFVRYPHMRQPMDDRADNKALMCGSQTGKTTAALADVYHFCDTHKVRVVFTMHTDRAVREFSATRARPSIKASPYLSKRIHGIDSVEIKTFAHDDGGRSTILFRGAQSENAALSEPADMLVHDEIDRSRPDILTLYISRIAASEWGRRIVTSTPTLPKYGIHACWEDSSQTQWLVKCPTCGDEQALAWPDSIAIDAEVPHYMCGHGHELTREVIRAGRWVSARTDATPTWSMYQFSRMLMTQWSADRIVRAELSREYQDYPELFYNEVLGEPKSSGDMALNEEILANAMVGFPPAARADRSFGGVDQSPKPHNHRVLIGTEDAEGSTAYIHAEVCGWDRLAELMTLYNIERLVVDALPETSKARELQAEFPGRVYLAYYPNQAVMKTADKGSIVVGHGEKSGQVDLDRTATLDQSARRIQMQHDFFCAMPARLRTQFVTEMTNMVRGTEKDKHGQSRSFWAEVGPDHWRHAHNYATVAGDLYRRWGEGITSTSLDLTPQNVERTVEGPNGEKLVVRPGHIPQAEGVVGPGSLLDWRKR